MQLLASFDGVAVNVLVEKGPWGRVGWQATRGGRQLWIRAGSIELTDRGCNRCREHSGEEGHDLYTHTTYDSDLSDRVMVCDQCYTAMVEKGEVVPGELADKIEAWIDDELMVQDMG